MPRLASGNRHRVDTLAGARARQALKEVERSGSSSMASFMVDLHGENCMT